MTIKNIPSKPLNGVQLELFAKPRTEMDIVWEEIEKLRHSQNIVRKRLFGEIKELNNRIIELQAENQRIRFHSGCEEAI